MANVRKAFPVPQCSRLKPMLSVSRTEFNVPKYTNIVTSAAFFFNVFFTILLLCFFHGVAPIFYKLFMQTGGLSKRCNRTGKATLTDSTELRAII